MGNSGVRYVTAVLEQLLRRDVKQFWGGLVFKAHRLVHHSTVGWRVIERRREDMTATRRSAIVCVYVVNSVIQDSG